MDTSLDLNFSIDFNAPEVVSLYDELPLWSAMFGLLMLKHLPLRPAMQVLDVGCGTGFPLFELAQRLGPGSRLCGLDPWAAALRRAWEKQRLWNLPNVELHLGSAEQMPFEDGRFDLLVSNLGINNFNRPAQVLAECRRVTRPAGRLVMTTNLKGHMQEFYTVFAETLRELGQASALDALQAHIDHRATIESLGRLLEQAGWRVERVVEETQTMRFANGSALLNHYFIKLGFLDGWLQVVAQPDRAQVFARLEARLNELAGSQGELNLTIPMAYIEAARQE